MPRVLPFWGVFVALLACSCPAAQASVIASQTAGFSGSAVGPGSLGQSVTTPDGGPWNAITFNLFNFITNAPFAYGTLYLLADPFAGNVADLGSATAGYVADTSTITDGAWVFPASGTLQPNTQYYFYMASGVPAPVLFGVDLYAGGLAYQTDSRFNWVEDTAFDLNFSLAGTAAVATPEPAAAIFLAPAYLALWRNRRSR